MHTQFRQGDVLVDRIEKIPDSAIPSKGKIVLAEGEATGHAHTIRRSQKVKVFTDGPQLYLRVLEPVGLEHQEHATLTIEPGDYIVRRQVEVWLEEVRRVAD